MTAVACFAATTGGVAYVTMTSTLSRTNSFANLSEMFVPPLRPAILDPEVAALDPAEFAEPLHEGGDPSAPGRGRGRAQDSDCRQLARLLRTRGERPRSRRAAEQRDDLASSYAEHGLPSRNPLCQLTAGSGCPGCQPTRGEPRPRTPLEQLEMPGL